MAVEPDPLDLEILAALHLLFIEREDRGDLNFLALANAPGELFNPGVPLPTGASATKEYPLARWRYLVLCALCSYARGRGQGGVLHESEFKPFPPMGHGTIHQFACEGEDEKRHGVCATHGLDRVKSKGKRPKGKGIFIEVVRFLFGEASCGREGCEHLFDEGDANHWGGLILRVQRGYDRSKAERFVRYIRALVRVNPR